MDKTKFLLTRINSLQKDITEIEKKHKTVPHAEAKIIWDQFLKIHNEALKSQGKESLVPSKDYDDAESYYSGMMIQIMKTTLRGIQDAIPNSDKIDTQKEIDPLLRIEHLCKKFHVVARQLRDRYENRETLDISDEYDVQDLLYALLKIDFTDVRKEEWTPSYAGSSSRMDFLLKIEKIVIETKKTRKGLGVKELGDQLIIDIERYQKHPDCETLVCFVYDPEGKIGNPEGIEKDLSRSQDGFIVKVFIMPKGY